jgi:hypothetical protein
MTAVTGMPWRAIASSSIALQPEAAVAVHEHDALFGRASFAAIA